MFKIMAMDLFEVKNLLHDSAVVTTLTVLIELGQITPFMSKRDAFRKYGEGTVKKWIADDLVKVYKDGDNTAKCRLDRIELETVSRASNRIAHKSVRKSTKK